MVHRIVHPSHGDSLLPTERRAQVARDTRRALDRQRDLLRRLRRFRRRVRGLFGVGRRVAAAAHGVRRQHDRGVSVLLCGSGD